MKNTDREISKYEYISCRHVRIHSAIIINNFEDLKIKNKKLNQHLL